MRNIKIFRTTEGDYSWEMDDHSTSYTELTGWEEVDDETYEKVEEYCRRKVLRSGHYFIVENTGISIPSCVKEFTEMIAEEEEKKEKASKAKAKKRAITKAKKEGNQEAAERKKLKELQEKYK